MQINLIGMRKAIIVAMQAPSTHTGNRVCSDKMTTQITVKATTSFVRGSTFVSAFSLRAKMSEKMSNIW
jgi:hypothetical protein